MKICLLDKTNFQYSYNDKQSSLLRGAETILINLYEQLKNFGHEIVVFNNCSENINNDNSNWYNIKKIKSHDIDFDVAISNGDARLFDNVKSKKKFLISYSIQSLEKFIRKGQLLAYIKHKPSILVIGKYHQSVRSKITSLFGINILKLGDYIDLTKIKIKYFFTKPKIEQLTLKVNQKTILQIEIQRQLRKKNFGILPPKYFNMYNMQIQYQGKNFKAKMRIKGERPIHWQNKRTSSYKIDLIGNDRLWGMEEFSVQKPITKNYAYEFLFHKFLKRTNNLYLKYFPINLYFNDENRGVYAVEESFSKELLERQKKRERAVPEYIVKKSWKGVQENIGKFQSYFRPSNFIVVDNNNAGEDVFKKVSKRIRGLVKKKVTNPIAIQWIAMQMQSKRRK